MRNPVSGSKNVIEQTVGDSLNEGLHLACLNGPTDAFEAAREKSGDDAVGDTPTHEACRGVAR